jgi:site-specific DNA-methyltransferase (adenine-specific)/adenine-specific DNA-methyltransferase
MTPEQREELIRLLKKGEEISPEWARFLFPPEKREYELVYHSKEREEDILASTLAVPLQPVRTFGKNGKVGNEEWQNMLIFGDNLQVMKSLLELKKSGKLCNSDGTSGVRLVYIDPPFATKQDFRGGEDQKAYQDKIAGARFLEFLRQRLVLLHRLLSDNGLLYVHLDYRKCHYVKVLLDEIFGERNFMSDISWCYSERELATRHWNRKHDTLFVYGRNLKSDQHVFNWEEAAGQYSKGTFEKYEHTDKDDRLFQLRGRNVQGSPWRGKHGIPLQVEKDHPEWVYRDYLDEKKGIRPRDWWTDIPFLNRAGGDRFEYPSAKNPLLLDRIIRVCTNRGDLVLDAFAGSGTAAAVSERLGRRWIAVDCGKLAVYTMQKRLLTLRKETGNKGPKLECKQFTLYNAGLYDFSKLKELPWEPWRFFALQLFQCRDEPHKIGGFPLDGYLKGASVLVFNHTKNPGARFTEETLEEIHEAVGSRVGNKLFIIAPALTFGFQQDYIDMDSVRYYALRIPYSIINELHQREFTALKQPSDEMAVNDTVEAVGFDFIRTPELKFECGIGKRKGELLKEGFIQIQTFKSEAVVREPLRKKGNLETLSMVMLDYDYDGEVFDLDTVFYADALAKANWEVRFPLEGLGGKLMAVFTDIYGNEARIVLDVSEFGAKAGKKARKVATK